MRIRFLILAFGISIFCLAPGGFAMATGLPDNFSFTYKGQGFIVDKATLTSWQGRQLLKTNDVLSSQTNLNYSLLSFIGQPAKKPESISVYNFQLAPIYKFTEDLAQKINVDPIEPILKIENNLVTEFTPPQTGIKINIYKTALATLESLGEEKKSLEITAYESEPKTSLSATNNLGINELLAEGVSNFKGSPNNRRHNITVGCKI
jgi:vancomycin resistance protein YoaR